MGRSGDLTPFDCGELLNKHLSSEWETLWGVFTLSLHDALPIFSFIEPGLAIYFTYDNIHVLMLFSQIIPPSPSPTESKSLLFTSVSLLLAPI